MVLSSLPRGSLASAARSLQTASSPAGAAESGAQARAQALANLKERRALPSDGLTLADFLPGGSKSSETAAAAGCGAGPARAPAIKKPPWLKMYNPHQVPEDAERYKAVKASIAKSKLATVCQEARCPNMGECWSGGTATVMIMGDTCTRGCRFCSVATSRTPPAPDPDEPAKVAEAVHGWGVDYIVLTMVDRDDLPDQGAAHVAATVRNLKDSWNGRVETLIGDYQGKLDLITQVVEAGMDVFAHNIETVERLQRTVRDRRANYDQSLRVLRHVREVKPDIVTKSSVMLGLGETVEEVHQTMRDLREAGVDILTFGQYLQPTKRHMKVTRYVTPGEFDDLKKAGEALGFHMASGPLVRSSYRAGELFKERLAMRAAAASTAEGAPRPLELHLGTAGFDPQAETRA
jgi:lipoic acid synthetase